MTTATIQQTIRAALARRGMTQAQLAEAIGTSQSAIGLMLTGKRRITTDSLMRIARAISGDDVEATTEEMIVTTLKRC